MEPLAESAEPSSPPLAKKSFHKKTTKPREQAIEDVAKEIINALPQDMATKDEIYIAIVSYLKKIQKQERHNIVEEIIDIEQSLGPTSASNPSSKSTTTVAELLETNSHVAALPTYMLKNTSAEISQTDIQRHTLAQGLLYLGIPASTLPMFANNPKNFGIGFGIGIACGALIATISTAKRNTTNNEAWQWLARSAAVTNIYKGALGGLQAGGIAGNVIASLLNSDKELFAVFEGGVAGAITGYEGVDMLLNIIHQCTESQGETEPPALSESQNPLQGAL